jgi:hypothetical protein
LTEEEHELLVRLKGERANPYEVRTQPGEPRNAGESGNRRSLVEEIEALDKVLSKASQVKTGETSRLLMGLMGAAEPAVRMTALNWLVSRSDVMMEALSMGLRDKDYLVRTVAAQLLLDRGVSDEALHRIQEVAEVDPTALDQVLRNSYASSNCSPALISWRQQQAVGNSDSGVGCVRGRPPHFRAPNTQPISASSSCDERSAMAYGSLRTRPRFVYWGLGAKAILVMG